LADFPILAVHAAKVAPTEEDGSRSVPTAQHAFLSKVGTVTMDYSPFAGPANRALDGFQSIDPAVAGTQITLLEMAPGSGDACG
jgi:hypothetical protein